MIVERPIWRQTSASFLDCRMNYVSCGHHQAVGSDHESGSNRDWAVVRHGDDWHYRLLNAVTKSCIRKRTKRVPVFKNVLINVFFFRHHSYELQSGCTFAFTVEYSTMT